MEDRWIFENGIYRKATEEEIAEIESGPEYISPTTKDEQAITLMRSMARTSTTISDKLALIIPDILPTWKELLDEGKQVEAGVCLMHEGQCYRTKQPVTPLEHQPPGSEGMLAIYVPIDREHAGTLDDPIPFIYGMETKELLYYSYKGKIYRVAKYGGMPNCVYPPDTGIWQWEYVQDQ